MQMKPNMSKIRGFAYLFYGFCSNFVKNQKVKDIVFITLIVLPIDFLIGFFLLFAVIELIKSKFYKIEIL